MILKIIAAFSCLLYLLPKIKLGFHMLQQEFYLTKNYARWVKKHPGRNFAFFDIVLAALLLILSTFLPIYITYIFWTAVNVLSFLARINKKEKAKKPLVFTARVKRLSVCAAILLAGYGTAVYFLLGKIYLAILLQLAASLFAFLFVIFSNILAMPVEKMVAGYYIGDAKKIINKMSHIKVVGITGSYGKTSSKYILAELLSAKYDTLMTPESYNTTMGVVRTIRERLKPIHEIFVCEMGAQNTGEIKEICDIVKPNFGIITSIGPQHLETFKSLRNIIKTKLELTDSLSDKSCAVVNLSSEHVKANKPTGATSYSLTKEDGGDYFAKNISYGPFGARFTICGKDIESFDVETKLLGKHNILNIVGAAAMALKLGMTPEEIARAAKRIKPVPHRLELKKQAGGISVIDDAFNSNVEGSKSAVEVLGSFERGKRMLITPGMVELGDKQYEYNFKFGEYAAKNCDYIILVGEKQTLPIKEGLGTFPQDKIYVAKDLNDALGKMREVCTSGWTVLFENDLPDLYNN